jgi:sugar/nucleoside kinase (ribokinase family)
MTESTVRLISVGNVVIDIVADVPSLPERGGDVVASRSEIAPGGGFNVMVAAVRQGLTVGFAGAHGIGPFGDLARAALEREGIEILDGPTLGLDTGWDVAIVDGSGERTFVTAVGAEATVTAERLTGVSVADHDFVYVSGYGLLREPNRSAIADWLDGIPETACVLVDPGPLGHQIQQETLARIHNRADWWSCNERESFLATGHRDVDAAIRALGAAMPSGSVIVRRGAAGSVVLVGHEIVEVPGFDVSAVDTNGAGDAHTGGFLAALAEGLAPLEAVRRANACAALAVTRRGPSTAPTRAEVDTLLAVQ